jgi:hypothetical protein
MMAGWLATSRPGQRVLVVVEKVVDEREEEEEGTAEAV